MLPKGETWRPSTDPWFTRFLVDCVSWPWRHHVTENVRRTQEVELSADPAGCCWCLKLLLFGHCVALICSWHWRHIKAEKGTRRAFTGGRADEEQGTRLTARTLNLRTSCRRASSKAWTFGGKKKEKQHRQPAARRALFVYVVPVWTAILNCLCLEFRHFFCTYAIYIYTLRGGGGGGS